MNNETNVYYESKGVVMEYEYKTKQLILRTHDRDTVNVVLEIELPHYVVICEANNE